MINEAIILAGGFGTRLTSVKDIPKPMAPINEIPFLQYLLDSLNKFGITKIHLAVGYKYEVIENYFGHQYKNCQLNYVVEDTPLGTGGAIKKALENVISEEVFIINGDTFFQVNFKEMYSFYKSTNSIATLALKPMLNFERYGTVEMNDENRIVKFSEKQYCKQGLINGGVYILKTHLFDELKFPEQFSLEQDYFEKQYANQQISGYINDSYFIDIGIPSDYEKAQLDLPKLF